MASSTPRFLLNTARQVVRPRSVVPFGRRGNATQVEPLNQPKPWSRQEVQEVYDTPLFELIFRAVSRFSSRPYLDSRVSSSNPTFTQPARFIFFLARLSPTRQLGQCAPIEPPARPSATVHLAQHQNRRLLRGLLVLRPVEQVLRQGRTQGGEAHRRRNRPRVSLSPLNSAVAPRVVPFSPSRDRTIDLFLRGKTA